MDLDQSGNSWQKVRTFLGPSLGWVDRLVKSETYIGSPGTYVVQPGDNVLFVFSAGVNITLPDVRRWVNEYAYQPATGFERALWIKDLGYASGSPVTVSAAAGQLIDNAATVALNVNFALLKLWPFNNLSGWWMDVTSGGGGGGAMFTSATAFVTSATPSVTSITVLNSNAGRKGLILQNTDANAVYIKFGTTAAPTSFTVKIPPNSYWEMTDTCVWTGRIDAIWAPAAGGGILTMTEMV